jgi:hypothetical protein
VTPTNFRSIESLACLVCQHRISPTKGGLTTMKWPLQTPAVPRAGDPAVQLLYLHAPGIEYADPTILWGTEIDATRTADVARIVPSPQPRFDLDQPCPVAGDSSGAGQHPHLNRRVVGRRVFAFREINLRLAFQNPASGEVDVVLVRSAERCTLQEIAGVVWRTLLSGSRGEAPSDRDRQRMKALPSWGFHALLAVYRWLDRRWALPTVGRLDDLRCSAVLVNDLSFRNAPPMRCYKPTRFPDESISVNITLGPMEEKVVVRDGQPVASTVAPLFVRVDHRIVDAYQLGRFLATLRDFLQDPAQLDALAAEHRALTIQDQKHSHDGQPDTLSRKIA